MSAPIKQNVFVPEYPNQKPFEEYHAVPAQSYLQSAKVALEGFIQERNNCTYTVSTLKGTTKNIRHLNVTASNDEIKIDSTDRNFNCSIKPSKYGADKNRFWFFDNDTLKELNVERVCKL